jgi:monovalent cation:H+ antiporter-2, CPA2 family
MIEGIAFIRDLAVVLLAATAGGWLARRIGLSPVAGYLAAGLLVGTPEVTFIYVTDPDQVRILSHLGLVFLMFSIGLGIRIRRIVEMGIGPLLATVLTALLVLAMTRAVAAAIGLSAVEGWFFAGMLMVSSSAIIGKLLQEQHALHSRHGQMALSQTLLEDFVAIVMLTFLGSLAAYEQASAGGIAVLQNLGKLAAFVLLLLVSGLVLLPKALEMARRRGGPEILVVLVCGIVFGLALVTVMAGYSLALGAFLCGVMVAVSPRANFLEKAFSGMRDAFTAVFFVAIGMGIDLSLSLDALDLILWGLLLAVVGRCISAMLSWMIACETAPNSLRAALLLTPIGEFSFIMAGIGVSSGLIPERFQVAAVGLSFLTSLAGPLLAGGGERLARRLPRGGSGWLAAFGNMYRNAWLAIGRRRDGNLLVKLLRKRFWQILRELLWSVALLLFARPVYGWLAATGAARGGTVVEQLLPLFWLGVLLLVLVALISILRNIAASTMIIVNYLKRQLPGFAPFQRVTSIMINSVCMGLILLLLTASLPWKVVDWRLLGVFMALTLAMTGLFYRRFIRIHSHAEHALQELMTGDEGAARDEWTHRPRDWGLFLEETIIPDPFPGAGKTIAGLALRKDTGATVVAVERQGVVFVNPGPEARLFPEDRVFLLGNRAQNRAARERLEQEGAPQQESGWNSALLEGLRVPEDAPAVGRTLADLDWPRHYNVQVVAARPLGGEAFAPGGDWQVEAGAEILLAGPPDGIQRLRQSPGNLRLRR